ncbi:MAG: TadE/TadG family type IV pilus assembly protein [Chloroflexota bacterium]
MNNYQPRWVKVKAEAAESSVLAAPVLEITAAEEGARPARRRKGFGQGLVEFALIAPLLLLIIFGIIDIARLVQAQVTVSNSARQAVRWAVTGQRERDGRNNNIPRDISISRIAVESLGGLPLDASVDDPSAFGFYRVRVLPDGTGAEPAGGKPNQYVQVDVFYNVQLLTPLVNAILPRVLVHGYERSVNEEWGAVTNFDHANLPPLPTPPPTWTPYMSPTPTMTPTPGLVIASYYSRRITGTGAQPLYVEVNVTDNLGNLITDATVNVTAVDISGVPSTGTLAHMTSNLYGACGAVTVNPPANVVQVSVTASKPGLASATYTWTNPPDEELACP